MSDINQNVTVRKQKIRKNHVRAKLIFFTILVLILLVVSGFCTKALSVRSGYPGSSYGTEAAECGAYHGNGPLWKRYVLTCPVRKHDQYLCDIAPGSDRYRSWNHNWYYLWLVRRNRGYDSDANIGSLPGISKPRFCTGSSRRAWRGNPECDHSSCGDRMAEVCQTCQRTDACHRKILRI